MDGDLVVVTGASTGIGEATARRLARMGFHVLAGVRRDEDAGRMTADPTGRIEPVRLDVTSAPDVAALAERVSASPVGALRGLVNNAGVAVVGPIEVLEIADWRRQLEVNVLGQVQVTRALLPALLRARGRVINMSSIGGLIASPLFGPYSASKFAIEAFTDVLRREVGPFGIRVVAIEPGVIATPIWDKGRAEAIERVSSADPAVIARYQRLSERVAAMAARGPTSGLEPDAVAQVVARALVAD